MYEPAADDTRHQGSYFRYRRQKNMANYSNAEKQSYKNGFKTGYAKGIKYFERNILPKYR
jgi:hypothetical protein